MKIDVKTIKELSKNIEKYGLEEITLEAGDSKVTLKREAEKVRIPQETQVIAEAPKIISNTIEETPNKEEETIEVESIKSPMVGTYYGAPSPDAKVFVKEGEIVESGDTLCIVEAMKLMNEVKAEKKCKVIKKLLADGEAVTKGLDLFLIEEL